MAEPSFPAVRAKPRRRNFSEMFEQNEETKNWDCHGLDSSMEIDNTNLNLLHEINQKWQCLYYQL